MYNNTNICLFTQSDEVMQLKNQINSQAQEAHEKIVSMQEEEREKFQQYMEKRLNQITESFAELTADVTEEEKAEIREQMEAGSNALDSDDW